MSSPDPEVKGLLLAVLVLAGCGAPPSPRDLGVEPLASFELTFDS